MILNFFDKLKFTEKELSKRLSYSYTWGRKQNKDWDFKTDFIYKTHLFDDLVHRLESMGVGDALFNHAINRWYNFHSAQAVEAIFKQHSSVISEVDTKHQSIDFYINGIAFDHKSSVFPKGFDKSIEYALANKAELAYWFYKEQSTERRFHQENRLFIVMYESKGNHWMLKSRLSDLYNLIHQYLNQFDSNKLIELQINDQTVLCDVLIFKV